MYEMVTGRVPFDGETTVAVAIQHLQEEMVVPSVYAPGLPISYEKIILKCTQKNPERRYQTVAELLADLRQSLVTPESDCVVIAPVIASDTRIINGDELNVIQTYAEEADLESENGFVGVVEQEEYVEEEEETEDATGFLDPRMEKIVTIAGIGLFAVILLLVAWLSFSIAKNLFNFGKQPTESGNSQQTESQIDTESESKTDVSENKDQVKMIKLIGMSYEEAKAALEKIGLDIFVVYQKSNQKDGTVLDQSEKTGNMVEKGSTITVIVAGDNPTQTTIKVPNVVNETEGEAEKILKKQGFLVSKEYQNHDTVETGKVI
jgi:serine/threonine-protein kinase